MDYAKIAQDAKAERAELAERIQKLDLLIATVESLSGASTTSARPARAATPRASNVMSPTRDAVARILRAQGRAMQTAELVPILKAAGVAVGGKNEVATLSARLSNSDDFVNNRGIGWWFTGETVPGTSSLVF
jgi:hypothetical protein